MKIKKSFLFIHGFLGQATDWEGLVPRRAQSILVDLFFKEIPPSFDFKKLAKWINQKALSLLPPRVLVGYSFGGRIAFHALLEDPDLWSGALVISAHLGLSDPTLRSERVQRDELWAKKFEKQDWDSLLLDWNSQSIFIESSANHFYMPTRSVDHFSRQALVKALRESSLGLQEDLRIPLQNLKKKILWIVGAQDEAYCTIAKEFHLSLSHFIHSGFQSVILEKAGHRLLFEKPEAIASFILDF